MPEKSDLATGASSAVKHLAEGNVKGGLELLQDGTSTRRRSFQRSLPQPNNELSSHPSAVGYSLKDAAKKLGVSYWTARRLLIAENVARYSTAGDVPVYPSTPLKKFQRVRMTYIISDSDIERVRKKMREK